MNPTPPVETLGRGLSRAELERAHCWEADDAVAGRADMTAFRRTMRWCLASWREHAGHPIGTQPIRPRPGKPSRLVGSRLPLEYAERTGANLLTPTAVHAVRHRLASPERHQSLDRQRLWADLTWSSPLAFNLFADLDPSAADRLVHEWFPDAPSSVTAIRFLHSPGRLDASFTNSLRDFNAMFELTTARGVCGFVAVDVKFFERTKPEQPKPENLDRLRHVADRSGVFTPGAVDHLAGRTEHCVMWLEHLLALSMLQHPSRPWTWGRYVVIHQPANPMISELLDSYHGFLDDTSTYRPIRLDHLLDAEFLAPSTTKAVRDRYLCAEHLTLHP